MNGPDINGYGQFGTQEQYNIYLNSLPATEVSKTEGNQSASTISKSDIEQLALALIAGYPILAPPLMTMTNFSDFSAGNKGINGIGGVTGGAAVIAMTALEKQHEIISSMWDKFIENIKEVAERAKKDDIEKWTKEVSKEGPKSGAEYLAYLLALSIARRTEELENTKNPVSSIDSSLSTQLNNAFNQWFKPSDDPSVIGSAYPNSAFTAGCMACSPDVIRDAIGGVTAATLGFQISTNSPLADALFAVGPNSGLPGDAQAAAALIAALLNTGAVNKATYETVNEAASKGQPPADLNFALSYAKNILAIITHNANDGQPVSEDRKNQDSMIKLMLGAMALNMLYRAGYGGMTGEEFASLFSGNTADIPDLIKPYIESLVAQIKNNLPEDPALRMATLNSLMEYVDSKHSVASMLDTTRLLKALLSTDEIEQKRFEVKT